MTRVLVLLATSAAGCTTWYAERLADTSPSLRDPAPSFVDVRAGWVGADSRFTREPPSELREAYPALVGCGVPADLVLEARVLVRPGAWPWEVKGLDGSPEERCVADVLSTLPLDDGLRSGSVRVLDLAAKVGHLRPRARSVEASAPDQNRCEGFRDHGFATQGHHTDQSFPGAADAAVRVTCPHAEPLTRLELVWRFGALEEVRTTPQVACVEAAARELVGRDPALLARWSQQAEAAAWDELRCELQVPLRPEVP